MENIVLLDKPVGITSAKALERLKRALGAKKAGHAGTLDPMATGLLVVGVGEGTKELSKYVGLPKTYEADILLGVRTATGDMEGEVIEEKEVGELSRAEIERALTSMEGVLRLPVSLYSAMKRGGEPLYKKARRGEAVTPPVRDMEVMSAQPLGIDGNRVRARFEVGSGTYIRSLAEELGRRLGLPATLAQLRRTRVGQFRVEDARALPQI